MILRFINVKIYSEVLFLTKNKTNLLLLKRSMIKNNLKISRGKIKLNK